MRGVRNALPFVGESEGGTKGTEEKSSAGVSDGSSAIERISRGHEGVPESVGEYSLDMNSPINVRWTRGDTHIECSRTGNRWRTEVHRDGDAFVVSEHGSFDEAVTAAESLVSGTEGVSEEAPITEFEEEVESMLEDVDQGSVSAVGEAFGD